MDAAGAGVEAGTGEYTTGTETFADDCAETDGVEATFVIFFTGGAPVGDTPLIASYTPCIFSVSVGDKSVSNRKDGVEMFMRLLSS